MRVPLIFYVPGLEGRTDDSLVQHIDVPPTLLSMLGLPNHPSFQGRDLTKESKGGNSVFLMAQTPLANQYGIIRGDHKLMFELRTNELQLYDLKSDPGEKLNLIASKPEIKDDLLRRLKTWMIFQMKYYEDSSLYSRTYPPYFHQ